MEKENQFHFACLNNRGIWEITGLKKQAFYTTMRYYMYITLQNQEIRGWIDLPCNKNKLICLRVGYNATVTTISIYLALDIVFTNWAISRALIGRELLCILEYRPLFFCLSGAIFCQEAFENGNGQ